MTTLFYNNRQIASGQPVPLVGRSEEMIRYGERWGIRSSLTLQGTLTGCTYEQILSAQSGLMRDFSQDFQPFQIVENETVIFEKKFGWVRSINFSDSRYIGALGYTVTMDCYEQEFFSGIYGVVDPSNEWNFSQEPDGKVRIVHTVSARGFNTTSGNSNAFQNAKDFVLGNTGWRGDVSPAFITGGFTSPCMQSFAERPDRLSATYSVTENYVHDPNADSCIILRYASDYQCNALEGKAAVTLRGEIGGGMFTPMSGVRARYAAIDFVAIAKAVGGTGINSIYVSSGTNEDPNQRKISFELVFDNLITSGQTWFDYATNMEIGDGGLTRASLQGTIRTRGGSLASRNAAINAFQPTIDFFGLVNAQYTLFNTSPAPLNPFPLVSGESHNDFQAERGFNLTFDNRLIPNSPNLSEFVYSYQVVDAVQQVAAMPLVRYACAEDKSYYLTDLGFQNRAEFSIEGTAKPICGLTAAQVLDDVRGEIDTIRLAQVAGNRIVLTKHDFTTRSVSDGEQVQFSCAWSFEPIKVATSPQAYSQIADLSVN